FDFVWRRLTVGTGGYAGGGGGDEPGGDAGEAGILPISVVAGLMPQPQAQLEGAAGGHGFHIGDQLHAEAFPLEKGTTRGIRKRAGGQQEAEKED
ncbi:MAG: hypothetical protein JWL81_514, partial [Verrucomicrobiales bacterium]|nr:hypothetical protein [Verrucomicrobiales bacterium]